jgi:hypothetical protein
MKRTAALAIAALILGASLLQAHDLFIKLESYFLAANRPAVIRVINGTFVKSENWITPDRVEDISLVSAAGRARLDTMQWRPSKDSLSSLLTMQTGPAGVKVIGVATRSRDLHLEAADFNDYLKVDGIPDVLEARRQNGELDLGAWERYAKHVKAVVQVGGSTAGPFDTVLGYPAEIVPLVNPYALKAGATMRVRCLVDGKPVANQLVIVGGEGAKGETAPRSLRTDAAGEVSFGLPQAGRWFAKFISMTRVRGQEELDYVSQWATLTFEIR